MAVIFNNLGDPKLVKLLDEGGIGILPTDTVYGLVCLAGNQKAVESIYSLKNRQNKPGTLIASSIEQLESLGFKRRYLTAVKQFWPGPFSVVIVLSDPGGAYLLQGLPDIAVRITADKKLAAILNKAGPILTTSANSPGEKPANTIKEAEAYFGDKVDFYVDGGDLKNRQPSTIIRIVDDAIEVIRQGAGKISPNN